MKFIVDTDKKTIREQGSKLTTAIPENHISWWEALEHTSIKNLYNPDLMITALWDNGSVIEFGSACYVDKEVDGQVERILEKSPVFCFDLKDYKVKSLGGTSIKPECIRHDFKHLRTYGASWVKTFYDYWKTLAFGKSNKSLGKFMFSLPIPKLNDLKVAEKILKSGLCDSIYALGRIQNSLLSRDIDPLKATPAEIFNVPDTVYKDLLSNEELLSFITADSARIDYFMKFNYWGDLYPVLKKLNLFEEFVRALCTVYGASASLESLIQDKSYDRSRLMEYWLRDLPQKQGFTDIGKALGELVDYAGMAATVYETVENKYPKALKTDHDIMVVKFNEVKTAAQNSECMAAYADVNFEYTSELYYDSYEDVKGLLKIVEPKCAQDIVDEGKAMHHCVASYIPKISSGRCHIVFMRSEEPYRYYRSKCTRHCTLEISENAVVQMRGIYNRDPNKKELQFLKEYCEAKNLNIGCSLRSLYESVVQESWESTKNRKDEAVCVA